jgi:hypothetical protein
MVLSKTFVDKVGRTREYNIEVDAKREEGDGWTDTYLAIGGCVGS